jgi:hypothetical protein
VVNHRRPQIARLDRQNFRQCLCFGLKPLGAPLGLAQRGACRFELLARRMVRGFCRDCGRFGFAERRLRTVVVGQLQAGEFTLDLGNFGAEPGGAFVVLANCIIELLAFGAEIGELGGQIAKYFFIAR